MQSIDDLWQKFAVSGKIDDYIAYSSVKDVNDFGDQKRAYVQRCTCSTGNERRGE